MKPSRPVPWPAFRSEELLDPPALGGFECYIFLVLCPGLLGAPFGVGAMDINLLQPSDVEAVEYLAGSASFGDIIVAVEHRNSVDPYAVESGRIAH